MAACMQYAFHMIETREQNKHHFWEVEFFLFMEMLYRKIMVRLHFIKNVLYSFIYCMSARIVFSISGIILSSWQFFLKKWNPFVKSKCHGEKMVMRPNLIKECIALFSQIIFSFARILLLIWRNIKQHVPSIQISWESSSHTLLSVFNSWSAEAPLFWVF